MELEKECPKTLTIIPDELIFDNILPRLPVKSLIRFKSVSKTWKSVISTPQFIKSHLHYSSSLSLYFLLQTQNSLHTLSYTHQNTFNQLINLNYPWNCERIQIIGCCNGLICLFMVNEVDAKSYHSYFVVWNPATSQHRLIWLPCHAQSDLCTSGFGYRLASDDYNIIASFSKENCLWVFSLRTKEWSIIVFPTDDPFLDYHSSCIHLDGTLYWDATIEHDVFCVCKFNLVDKQFSHGVPFSISEDLSSLAELSVFRGCLSIISLQMDHYDVFVMKQQDDLTLWEKLFSLPRVSDVIYLNFPITGKCLVRHNICIDESEHSHNISEGSLLKPYQYKIKLVDPTLEDLEHSQSIDFENGFVHSVHEYVESLVSPFTLM